MGLSAFTLDEATGRTTGLLEEMREGGGNMSQQARRGSSPSSSLKDCLSCFLTEPWLPCFFPLSHEYLVFSVRTFLLFFSGGVG